VELYVGYSAIELP